MAIVDGMKNRAAATAAAVNQALADQEADLIRRSSSNLAALKPEVSDAAAFDKLIQAVEESTQQNESVAAFKDRVTQLGQEVVKVAKEVYPLLS